MKQALISPNEPVYDFTNNWLGFRVAEVIWNAFPVAAPLFWIDCAEDVVADQFYWTNGEILSIPISPTPEPVTPPVGGGPAVL